MTHLVLGTALAVMLSLPLVPIFYNTAEAQERATCSQARSACGKQRACQKRYEACMRTGCWAALLVHRCGYVKR
jgi:hypothetical protein